jgi:hypothetical protein
MDFRGLKIDFAGLAQVILGVAALLTAWRGRQIAKEKKTNAERNKDDSQGA